MPTPNACIQVRDLRVVFPNGHEAIRSIDLDVPAGQFVCIIGRSGAGKSTLLRSLNGLNRPTSGTVVVDGTTVTGAFRPGSASSSRSSTWSSASR